jgi:hypothetical protein
MFDPFKDLIALEKRKYILSLVPEGRNDLLFDFGKLENNAFKNPSASHFQKEIYKVLFSSIC